MRQRKSTFTPSVDGLEKREVLSTAPTSIAHVALANPQAAFTHFPVFINTTIPYVVAPPGVHQFAINFTSNTFHQIINGLNSAAQDFAKFGSTIHLRTNLVNLAHRVPYGSQLLATWANDLANFGLVVNPLGGAATAPINANGATIRAALVQLETDLVNYIGSNVGGSFNVLKSGVNWSTDSLIPIYNGRVGHGPAHHQVVLVGTVPGQLM